jgi:hypothetical protein
MVDSEEQEIGLQCDPYLESSIALHFGMPLYYEFDLTNIYVNQNLFQLLSNGDTLDVHCIWCKKNSTFKKMTTSYEGIEPLAWRNNRNFDGLITVRYCCTRLRDHDYLIYYRKDNGSFIKVGQYPSTADIQIPQADQYRKILIPNDYKEFTRAIGLASHGIGIGSFVYLRRIFENLIEEAHTQAVAEDTAFLEDQYTKARMDEKIKMVSDYLPEFLVENRKLYGILSKGIHDLAEEECLKYFETVKIGIEQILDEKIIQKERADKAQKARTAIQKAHSSIAAK